MTWSPSDPMPEATVQELVADDDPGKLVIDVREPMETMHGAIDGARLVPLGQLESIVDGIAADANVYLVCRSGSRSGFATELLLRSGKLGAKNVIGGMIAWSQAGLPVVR